MEQRAPTNAYAKEGPFGQPDGSREDFKRFIQFEAGEAWGGIAIQPGDIAARVLVGKKGAGKTLYCRILEDAAVNDDNLYVLRQTQQLPTTKEILAFDRIYGKGAAAKAASELAIPAVSQFAELFEPNLRTEAWQRLWRRAIYLSAASVFFCANQRPSDVTLTGITDSQFFKYFNDLLPHKFVTPESVVTQVSSIITHFRTQAQIEKYLSDARWEGLERTVQDQIRRYRPICMFIDAIDEDFRHAPAAWLDCQKGLFYAVMRLLRDHDEANRLHIIVCVRDLVLRSVLRSEHATRYLDQLHIKVLDWGPDAARWFLSKKIEQLPEKLMMNASGRNVSAWLGRGTIRNKPRRTEEDMERYLLRHTRFLPRDVVIMGNALCHGVDEAKAKNRVLSEDDIRRFVSITASYIGREVLAICGNHLATSSLPRFGLTEEFTTAIKEYPVMADWAKEVLEHFVLDIGKDRFSWDELEKSLNKYQPNLSEVAERTQYRQHCIDTILWQHDLLGYSNGVRDHNFHFFSNSDGSEFSLPEKRPQYVFHPCLIDALHIRGVGRVPINAFGN